MASVFSPILNEFNSSSQKDHDCLSLILRYLTNAESHPGEEKYRRIRKENAKFNSLVWSREDARSLMLLSGFEEEGEFVVLPTSASCVLALESLRSFLKPIGSIGSEQQQPSLRLSTPAKALPPANESMLKDMTDMGFSVEACKAALANSFNTGIPKAIEWLEQHPNWEEEAKAAASSAAAAAAASSAVASSAAASALPTSPTLGQPTPAAATASGADQRSSYIPTKFQDAQDARNARARKDHAAALAAARQSKVQKKSTKKAVDAMVQVERENRAKHSAERMEEIYRSEGHYIKNASGAEAQAAAGRGTSNNTSQAVSPVSAASGGPTLADVCRLKIRYHTGTTEVKQFPADGVVQVLYDHVRQVLGEEATQFALVAMHNRSKLEDCAVSLRDAGLHPMGIVTVQPSGVEMKKGGGKVFSLHDVPSIVDWRQLMGKRMVSVVLFYRKGDDVSKAVAKAIESLCQDMTDGVVQKFSFDSQFLSVDTDAPTMKMIAHDNDVVWCPVVHLFFGRQRMHECKVDWGSEVNIKACMREELRKLSDRMADRQRHIRRPDDDEDESTDEDSDLDEEEIGDNEEGMQ